MKLYLKICSDMLNKTGAKIVFTCHHLYRVIIFSANLYCILERNNLQLFILGLCAYLMFACNINRFTFTERSQTWCFARALHACGLCVTPMIIHTIELALTTSHIHSYKHTWGITLLRHLHLISALCSWMACEQFRRRCARDHHLDSRDTFHFTASATHYSNGYILCVMLCEEMCAVTTTFK